MTFELVETALPGVLEITPQRFYDSRGYFFESYNQAALTKSGIDLVFVQDNQSFSTLAGVVRGLHYQLPPFDQTKLVRVLRGAILDVAVDIRKSSATFGRWVATEVSAEKCNQLLVPTGFAHGFITLWPETEVSYKVTQPYSPAHERAIRFDDRSLGIDWRFAASKITISDKDRAAPSLGQAELFD